jgi:hypothetical protein
MHTANPHSACAVVKSSSYMCPCANVITAVHATACARHQHHRKNPQPRLVAMNFPSQTRDETCAAFYCFLPHSCLECMEVEFKLQKKNKQWYFYIISAFMFSVMKLQSGANQPILTGEK